MSNKIFLSQNGTQTDRYYNCSVFLMLALLTENNVTTGFLEASAHPPGRYLQTTGIDRAWNIHVGRGAAVGTEGFIYVCPGRRKGKRPCTSINTFLGPVTRAITCLGPVGEGQPGVTRPSRRHDRHGSPHADCSRSAEHHTTHASGTAHAATYHAAEKNMADQDYFHAPMCGSLSLCYCETSADEHETASNFRELSFVDPTSWAYERFRTYTKGKHKGLNVQHF